jgi:hypothetical protein
MRWKNGKTPEERFWNQVNKTDSCWLWNGYINKYGYGHVGQNGRPRRVHIVSWEWHNGRKVKDGFHIHHICKNKLCVNPNHLEELSANDHWDQTLNSIKDKKESRNYCKHGHLLTESNSYVYTNPTTKYSTRRCKECQTIRNSKRNRTIN